MTRKRRKIKVVDDVKITIDSIDELTIEVYDEGYRKLGRFKIRDLIEKGLL